MTKLQQFLREHPIFTYSEFVKAINAGGSRSQHTLNAMLTHHTKQGHIIRIRRGLFASVPYGADPNTYPINPYVVAGYMTDDAIVSYHTALAFYGVTYSVSSRFIYLTTHRSGELYFRNELYQSTLFPKLLKDKNKQNVYVNTEDIQGVDIRVTSLERTLVDVMDRPLLGGGWEEIWRSLEMIERLQIDHVIDYALLLANATTIARVGFYLEQRQKQWHITEEQLEQLRTYCPVSPHYMDETAKKDGKFISKWNLIVPQSIINRAWEENLSWEPK